MIVLYVPIKINAQSLELFSLDGADEANVLLLVPSLLCSLSHLREGVDDNTRNDS